MRTFITLTVTTTFQQLQSIYHFKDVTSYAIPVFIAAIVICIVQDITEIAKNIRA